MSRWWRPTTPSRYFFTTSSQLHSLTGFRFLSFLFILLLAWFNCTSIYKCSFGRKLLVKKFEVINTLARAWGNTVKYVTSWLGLGCTSRGPGLRKGTRTLVVLVLSILNRCLDVLHSYCMCRSSFLTTLCVADPIWGVCHSVYTENYSQPLINLRRERYKLTAIRVIEAILKTRMKKSHGSYLTSILLSMHCKNSTSKRHRTFISSTSATYRDHVQLARP